jgi:hypothetical protein
MTAKNQIKKINDLFNSDFKNLLINTVNDNVSIFYEYLIKFYAKKHNITLENSSDLNNSDQVIDIFGLNKIHIYSLTNSKKINDLLLKPEHKIILTDYKNFKKFNNNYECMNGYKYESDIDYHLRNDLNIDEIDLILLCQNNPVFLFSETSKYLCNGFEKNKITDHKIKNHILDIRKSIYDIKINNFDIKKLYEKIKKETIYKKLNFLIY